MAKKFSIKKFAAGVLALLMVVTALPVSGIAASTAKAADSASVEANVVYRSYNPNNGEHLLTITEAEHKTVVGLGYNDEGTGWIAPSTSQTAIYRSYNPNTGEHLLVPQKEAEDLAKIGWNNEGIKMYSDDNKGVAIYRIYNPNATDAGSHLYTSSKTEAEDLVKLGWRWDNDGNPMLYGVKEEVVVRITDATQKASDQVTIKFDQDAASIVTKDEIKVEAADGTAAIPVNKIEFAEDGVSAVITLSTALTDKTVYNVVYLKGTTNESKADFTASVGEVSRIVVTTTTAEENVKTPIEFTLYDASGVDVTKTVKENNLTVEVDGDYISAELSKAYSANVTLAESGDEVVVTIKYNKNGTTQTEDVIGTGTITCVDPKATVGTPVFYQTTGAAGETNALSGAAKFYAGLKSSMVYAYEDVTLPYPTHFYVKDENGDAISYDSYEVESSDDDLLSVTNTDKNSGKYTAISVTGNKAGTANINIKAEKNGVVTPYMIPVTILKKQEATNVKISVVNSTLSNAYDEDYNGSITVTAVDASGIASSDFASLEIKQGDDKDYSEEKYLNGAALSALGNKATGFSVEGDNIAGGGKTGISTTFTAYGAKAATTYPIKVVLTKNDGKTVERTVNISVKALPDAAYDQGGNGVKVTYGIELTKNSLDSALGGDAEAKITASVNGIFAGYVRNGSGETDEEGNTYIPAIIGTPIDWDAEDAVAGTWTMEITTAGAEHESITANGTTYNIAAAATTATAQATALASAMSGDTDYDVTTSGSTVTFTEKTGKEGTLSAPVVSKGVETGQSVAEADKTLVLGDVTAGTIGKAAIEAGSAPWIAVASDSVITNVALGVKFGSLYADGGELYGLATTTGAPEPEEEGDNELAVVTVNAENETPSWVIGDESKSPDFARNGSYTVFFTYTNNKGEEKTASNTLTVKNSFYKPTVTVKSRTVESLDSDGIKEVLKTSVDLNNDEGENASVIVANLSGTAAADGDYLFAEAEETDGKINVKYVVITEDEVNFYVPINAAFKTE